MLEYGSLDPRMAMGSEFPSMADVPGLLDTRSLSATARSVASAGATAAVDAAFRMTVDGAKETATATATGAASPFNSARILALTPLVSRLISFPFSSWTSLGLLRQLTPALCAGILARKATVRQPPE